MNPDACQTFMLPLHQRKRNKAIEIEGNKTIFREFMGNSPQVKVLDFFIDGSLLNNGWSIVEIRKETRTGYSTLKKLLPQLVKKKILKVQKKLGKIKFYQLNKNNLVVQRMIAFDWELTKSEIPKVRVN